jgi:predicted thioesterase
MTTPEPSPARPPLNPAIRPGLAGEARITVGAEHLAPHTPKFSTPAMVMLIEQAAYGAVYPLLHQQQTVVGYEINVKHLAPADAGSDVVARSTLAHVAGNKLQFEVVVRLGDLALGAAELRMAIVPQAIAAPPAAASSTGSQ